MHRSLHAYVLTLAAILLAVAPANAKTICLVGDSLMLASTTSLTGSVSPWRTANVLQVYANTAPDTDPWHDATVYDFSVPQTAPSDWLGPIDPTRCVPNSTYWPMAKLACDHGDGMVDHVPALTCNIFLVLADASEVVIVGVEVGRTVDDIETLVLRLRR